MVATLLLPAPAHAFDSDLDGLADADLLSDAAEVCVVGSDPAEPDSDGGGTPDGAELGRDVADASGTASFPVAIPAGASGRLLHFVGLDATTCATTAPFELAVD